MATKKTLKKKSAKKSAAKIVKKVSLEKPVKQAPSVKAEKPVFIRAEKPAVAVKARKEKYYQGLGRRKTSIAQVRLFETAEKVVEPKDIMINGRTFVDYFTTPEMRGTVVSPFLALGLRGKMRVEVKVSGGGMHGQSDAVRLGISRALRIFDESFAKTLRDLSYLTRDARKVERKKAGLKKARRAPQWKKR